MVHVAGQLDCMEIQVVPSDKVVANARYWSVLYHPKSLYVNDTYGTNITCTHATMVSFPISPSGKTACDCSHLWTKFRSWGNGLRLVRYVFSIAMRSKVKHSNAVPVAPPSSLPLPSHSLGMASGISANPNLCSLTNAMRFNESLE